MPVADVEEALSVPILVQRLHAQEDTGLVHDVGKAATQYPLQARFNAHDLKEKRKLLISRIAVVDQPGLSINLKDKLYGNRKRSNIIVEQDAVGCKNIYMRLRNYLLCY